MNATLTVDTVGRILDWTADAEALLAQLARLRVPGDLVFRDHRLIIA